MVCVSANKKSKAYFSAPYDKRLQINLSKHFGICIYLGRQITNKKQTKTADSSHKCTKDTHYKQRYLRELR